MDKRPQWLFREISTRQWWEFGDRDNPTKVKHMAGFYDFRYAMGVAWVGEVSLLKLPGVTLSNRETRERQSAQINIPGHVEPETGVYVTSDPFTGFGSDNVVDAQTLNECRQERKQLLDSLEIAKLRHDPDEVAIINNQLEELNAWTYDQFVPGGSLKKLNGGDPLNKAAGAARKRKRRGLSQLECFGLNEIAEHLRVSYRIHPRTFTYCPVDPMPDWKI